ncbi:26S proteasome non-ATPase regulatory subunit 9-like isoform X1 [Teleopsis dalmanni]|uniref:26S proteasome non-ATPase regulatory subunit 9-like isoform X1 n=1 Tax=Teleopsis dalmanni TaxID=139649 RepID=UPI0018CCF7BE|nr:26S proteasome non-ATPase regulatory subunit 9-like isoform X1 [Teleopsis dalmanni]
MISQPQATKEEVLKLMSMRDALELKIKENGLILEANGNVGMNGPLVDENGFPRTDIDIYQVRQARQQIICLQNDHKTLMKQIEQNLHKLHKEASEEEQHQNISNVTANLQLEDGNSTHNASDNASPAIVKVTLISPGSPAEDAGLCVDDEIIEFGTINASNFERNLNQIGAVVNHMKDQKVYLKVRRGHQLQRLLLIPKIWSGRGLLGCNIVLLES